jgi:predicted nuclease with RNAse H fold
LTWYGADPGGDRRFGVAALEENGSFKTWLCSSVDEALTKIVRPTSVGIDCPLWWSSGAGGGRRADGWLRMTYKIPSGTVQSANSLKGAVLIQGIVLAMKLRKSYPKVPITESHPKALLRALGLNDWTAISNCFSLHGPKPSTDHERDALIGAVAAREGSTRRWKLDLALSLDPNELDPKDTCLVRFTIGGPRPHRAFLWRPILRRLSVMAPNRQKPQRLISKFAPNVAVCFREKVGKELTRTGKPARRHIAVRGSMATYYGRHIQGGWTLAERRLFRFSRAQPCNFEKARTNIETGCRALFPTGVLFSLAHQFIRQTSPCPNRSANDLLRLIYGQRKRTRLGLANGFDLMRHGDLPAEPSRRASQYAARR